ESRICARRNAYAGTVTAREVPQLEILVDSQRGGVDAGCTGDDIVSVGTRVLDLAFEIVQHRVGLQIDDERGRRAQLTDTLHEQQARGVVWRQRGNPRTVRGRGGEVHRGS